MKKSLFLSICSQALVATGQWGIAILIVKFAGLPLLGLYGLAMAVASPLNAFFNFGLRGIVVSTHSDDEVSRLMGFKVLSVISSLALAALVFYFHERFFLMLLAFATAKAIESFDDYWKALLQRKELFLPIFWSNALYTLVAVAGSFLLLQRGYGGLGVAGALIAARGIQITIDILFCAKFGLLRTVSFNQTLEGAIAAPRYIKEYSALGSVALLTALNSNIPKYTLQFFLGPKALGAFVALQHFMTAGANIAVASKNVLMPRLAIKWHNHRPQFYQFLKRSLIVTFITSLSGVLFIHLFGADILRLIYNENLAKQSSLLTLLLVAGAFMYTNSISNAALVVRRKLSAQPLFATLAGLCNLVTCWSLIPKIGLPGAIGAMVLSSFIFLFCASSLALKRE